MIWRRRRGADARDAPAAPSPSDATGDDTTLAGRRPWTEAELEEMRSAMVDEGDDPGPPDDQDTEGKDPVDRGDIGPQGGDPDASPARAARP